MRLWLAAKVAWTLLAGSRQVISRSTALLPSYPLAVKSPYLSTWVPGSQLSDIATARPQFWTGEELTWPILARVDGTSYALFGSTDDLPSSIEAATTIDVSYTATHTYFCVSAGDVDFVLDFFSPVYPKTEDFALHSLPYSYLTVNATSTENVQILNAIDQSWTAQGGAASINYTTVGTTGFFWYHNDDEIPFVEDSDRATWGSTILATTVTSNGSFYAHGTASDLYSAFVTGGTLSNYSRSYGSGDDLTALVHDLGAINGNSVTFAVGLDRVQAVSYLGVAQTGYYRTVWPELPDAVDFFLCNYDDALAYSLTLDSIVRSKTESVSDEWGSQYAEICEASFRQAIAPIELTVPLCDLGAAPSAFLKEISSNGNMETVDLIFQSWPIFIHLNPDWIILQFRPILEYLATGRWPQAWVIHDLGLHYPNATGHDDGVAEQMPLFETSTLFILMYAYQELSGDTSYTETYSDLLDGWAQYLVAHGLYPSSQLISVDAIAASANQTVLAMQSAIGLNAASKLLGNSSYSDTASKFAKTIYTDGLGLNDNCTHFTYNYGNDDSWNVIFAAFSDVFLNLTTFPREAWDMQSTWYLSQIQEAGLPWAGPESDKGVDWALTDWNIEFAAVGSEELQAAIVNTTYSFLTNGLNSIPFGTKYHTSGSNAGVWIANKARSSVGTHFAISALQQGLWTEIQPSWYDASTAGKKLRRRKELR
ncbi:hypothetical protein DOTSEDRAFT_118143 [Dothistroma septosporum NZE10]|uniref:DUF1793-domain-containing protein n=1 Tax=Dothistroma septosporum (strain NZE10 / CBS 128990) TaxID=675120 RepID=N1Q1T2_DOTSN|nr:hypothetical protein DOTSEDRAFT_118143 [Dothistroma septosporum NZE10]